MTIVAALEAVALIAVVVLFLRDRRSGEKAWSEERRELLNRIQAPDRLPVQPLEKFKVPDQEPDEWAMVGMIDIDPEYGLED